MRVEPKTAKEIIDLFGGTAALADAITGCDSVAVSCPEHHCFNWAARDRIPGNWLLAVLEAAKALELDTVTAEVLIKHAGRAHLPPKEIKRDAKKASHATADRRKKEDTKGATE